MPRVRLLIILLAAALLGAAGWWTVRTTQRQRLVAQHLPAIPPLQGWPAELGTRLAEADADARSWRHSASGLAALSRLYHANGFYPEALLCYDGLRAIQPREARWPHLQAAILADFGRTDEARPLRRQAAALAADYKPARLREADVLLKAGLPPDAQGAYEAVLRDFPGEPYALLGLARCAMERHDWNGARGHLQTALASNPDFIGALSLLVTVRERLGEPAAAEELRARIAGREFTDLPDPWLDELAAVCFDAYRLSVAAVVARASGDTARALALLERATALAPGVSSYFRQAAQIYLADRDYGSAKWKLEQAVAVNPADADAWMLLLGALRGLGQEAAASTALQQALGHCPQSPGLQLERARWLKAQGRLAEAIAAFRLSHSLRPSEATPLVELANTAFAADRAEEGLAALREALARQPGHPMALVSLTFYHIVSGDEAGARRHWEEVRRQPRTPPAMADDLRRAFRRQFGRDLP
ncbi:MAG: tetratricopeptide repeat protein [Verrucomicrobiota bacterium]